MNNQHKAFVLILLVACLSLVVLLPRFVNADEAVYQVLEFEGISYTSVDDAVEDALTKMQEACKMVMVIDKCANNQSEDCINGPNETPIELTIQEGKIIQAQIADGDTLHLKIVHRAVVAVRIRIGTREGELFKQCS